MHLTIVVFLFAAISTLLAQDCDQIKNCVDSEPLLNCSMVDGRDIIVYVLENIPVNSVVYCLDDALFFPNATTSYTVSSGTFSDHFSIDSDGTIVVKLSPNYEMFPRLASSISGQSSSNDSRKEVSMTVNVINVNEYAPRLTGGARVSFILTENVETFKKYQVEVRDEDQTQDNTFNITGTGSEDFEITVIDGPFNTIRTVLRLKQGLELDRERNPVYQLTIIAVDNLEPVNYSNPLHINVTVKDINDNAPQFTDNRTFTIPTGLPAGEMVGTASASDPDAGENGTVTYSIDSVQFSQEDLFIIDSTTGVLYTTEAYKGHMFTEGITNISVEIIAKDNGNVSMNSTAIFFIILQCPPQFTDATYVFSLEENKVAPFPVGNITASFAVEEDSVGFVYEVESSAMNRFTIDNRTGEIRSLVSFDRETLAVENFTVMAIGVMDQRLLSTATVMIEVIDQNDQEPQFVQEEYNFMITPQQKVVGRIHATDNDVEINAVVNFSTSINLDIPVIVKNIGNNTAEIIVNDDADLMEGEIFVFRVMATDIGGLQDTTIITLTIITSSTTTTSEPSNSTPVIVIATILSVVFHFLY